MSVLLELLRWWALVTGGCSVVLALVVALQATRSRLHRLVVRRRSGERARRSGTLQHPITR